MASVFTVIMDVTDVLRDRMQEASDFEGTAAAISLLGHAAFLAIVLLAPEMFVHSGGEIPKTVMTITLGGGAPGPVSGGLTPAGGRPIQEVRPPEEAAKPEALRTPAAKTPEMTLPEKDVKVKNARQPVKEAPSDAHGRTPTRGDEARPGTAAAETPVRGTGFGLTTGGGFGTGLSVNLADFCCPDYLTTVMQRINSVWNQKLGLEGRSVIKFTIERTGLIRDVVVEQSSGTFMMDLNAQRAIVGTRQVPPLPAAYTNPTLTLHLNFDYHR